MSCVQALEQFLSRYHQSYQSSLGEGPRYYARGEASPCVLQEDGEDPLLWQTIRREQPGSFANVSHALELPLHADIDEFYGQFFAAHLLFEADFGEGELLQPWSQDDFEFLQQNLIGHLMMKRKLKQPPTWFIGLLGQGDEMICVDNETGAVWRETPGELPSKKLADSLEEFLTLLRPRVAPAVEPVEPAMANVDHPGLWARMKLMWQHLFSRR
ncbi:SecY-interacting protein [Shewanella algae]